MLKNFMHPGPAGTSKTESGHTSATAAARPAESPQPAAMRTETPAAAIPAENGSKLIVGPNIKLKGSEITDCEILVVEGRVEASMKSRDIRIAEGGVFSGKAEIDVAEVRGDFEGDLTARKRLVIYATGKVSGVIRYGALTVEEGGSLSGEVERIGGDAGVTKLTETSKAATPPAAESAAERDMIQSGSTYLRNQSGRRQG